MVRRPVAVLHRDPPRRAVAAHVERDGLGVVDDFDAGTLRQLKQAVGKALAATHGLHGQAAPEPHHPVLPEGLPSVSQDPARPPVAHPLHCGERFRDEDVGEFRVGQPFGHPHDVVVEGRGGIGADVHGVAFLLRRVADELGDLVPPFVGEAEEPAGEVGVAAAEVTGSLFENQNGRARLPRRQGGGEAGVAGAHDHNVGGKDGRASRHALHHTRSGVSRAASV